MDSPKVRRALISVNNKMGLTDFARGLADAGVEIFSTGGTRRHLESENIPVHDVSEYTGFPEMMEGRLKTLHPKIHGGILARRDNPGDEQAMQEHGIEGFEVVAVNLYPFETTVAREDVTEEEAIEQIDIGGPTMVRAAAKNHNFVAILTNPDQYPAVLEQIRNSGTTTLQLRRSLAREAFAHTAAYDTAIARFFAERSDQEVFPDTLSFSLKRKRVLRYGENPHQQAALYVDPKHVAPSVVAARQRNGKELSYNNFLDLDAALGIVRGFSEPAVSVMKHNNPCGAAVDAEISQALDKAMLGDPVSAFGSVLGFNRPVDLASAERLCEPNLFIEAIIAPSFEEEALETLTSRPKWKKNVRLMEVGSLEMAPGPWIVRPLEGGALLQEADHLEDPEGEWEVVTDTQPDQTCRDDLRFAWTIVRFVKSNAITICKDRMLLGAGAGQMSRVDSVEIAIKKSGDRLDGAVLGSDAFFPFPDSIELAARAGVRAIIQPGGSRNDQAVIEACNRHGLPMIFTGRRHFRH